MDCDAALVSCSSTSPQASDGDWKEVGRLSSVWNLVQLASEVIQRLGDTLGETGMPVSIIIGR